MTATLLIVLATLAAAFTLALVAGNLRWKSGTRRLRGELEAARLPIKLQTYFVNELVGLPAPVQRYFRAALVDGLRVVADVAIAQTGSFNRSETKPAWKSFTATQRVITRRPGYFWDARIAMFPGASVRVRDAYVAGEGILQAAVLGLFPIANLRDSGELARGELMRFLAEAAWYPTALLPSQGVRWEPVDEHSARATLSDGAVTVALIFRFNATDLIEGVRAEARGRMVGANVELLPWEGRFWNYATRAGMHVPLDGEVSWIHPEGPKPYWRGHITRLNYAFAGGT
jgi:hypothetical protein